MIKSGDTYGDWEVIEPVKPIEHYAKCKMCGLEYNVRNTEILKGKGCVKCNRTINTLDRIPDAPVKVIKPYTLQRSDHGIKALVRCECGAEFYASVSRLKTGKVRSCGCRSNFGWGRHT